MCKIWKYIKKIKELDKNYILIFFVSILLIVIAIMLTNISWITSKKKVIINWPYSKEKQEIINKLYDKSSEYILTYNCKTIKDEQTKQYCDEVTEIVKNNKDKTKYIQLWHCKMPDARFYPNKYCTWKDDSEDKLIYKLLPIPDSSAKK
jgi:hypothetical protein